MEDKNILLWKEILQLNYSCQSLSNCHPCSMFVEMYHLYIFGCQSATKQQTGFVFCCVCLELQVIGSAFDLQAFFFQFIWLSTFLCGPHYYTEIKYTSKQLKLNKIKCAARHRRYMLIEHIYICGLISPSTSNFPLFIYLNFLRYSYRAAH